MEKYEEHFSLDILLHVVICPESNSNVLEVSQLVNDSFENLQSRGGSRSLFGSTHVPPHLHSQQLKTVGRDVEIVHLKNVTVNKLHYV